MTYRLGGELEITIADLMKSEVMEHSLNYNKENTLHVDTGRSALYLALLAIIQKGGKKEAWLPRFCCDSVILPFKQLGFKINYYSMGLDLNTPDQLPDKLDRVTLLFINYFGHRNSKFINWLEGCSTSQKTHFVIEDNVQATLNQNTGFNGDYVVYSFRKFLSQPDGAMLQYTESFKYELAESDESFVSYKLLGKIIRGADGESEDFLKLLIKSEEKLDQFIQPRKTSALSSYLFERTHISSISEIRITNWNYLYILLESYDLIGKYLFPIFNHLNKGEVPLGFAVTICGDYRDNLREYLKSNHIFCPIHWLIKDIKHSVKWQSEYRLSSMILTFPIDQRLSKPQLEYLVEKLNFFFRGRS